MRVYLKRLKNKNIINWKLKGEELIVSPDQDFFQGVEDPVIYSAFCVIVVIRQDNLAGFNVPETGELERPARVAIHVDGVALLVPVERPIAARALQGRERN